MPVIKGRLAEYKFDQNSKKNGGTANIYKGIVINSFSKELKVGDYVAIKVLFRNLAVDAKNVERSKLGSLIETNCKNLTKVFEFFKLNGKYHTIIEWLEGMTLAEALKRTNGGQQIDEKKIFNSILNGLKCLHNHSPPFYHRDVKPGNVMLCGNGRIVLFDFDTIKVEERFSMTIEQPTVYGTTLGTPNYAAPEQIVGNHQLVNASSDIYALGNLMYEACIGKPPYAGTTYEIMQAQVNDTLKIPDVVSDFFRGFIVKATQKKQNDRFQSVKEIEDYIKDFKDGKKIVIINSKEEKNKENKLNYIFALILFVFVAFSGIIISKFWMQQHSNIDKNTEYIHLVSKGDALIKAGNIVEACTLYEKANIIKSNVYIERRIKKFCTVKENK